MTLGLGVFKFPLLIPFLIPFVSKRRFRVVLGFALTSLVLAAVSIGTVGFSTAAYYPKYLRSIDRMAPGLNRPQDMPNLRGLMSMLLSTISGRTGALLLLVLSIPLIAYAYRKWSLISSERDTAFALGFALNVVATVLVSYHCHAFDLCVLLLPVGLVLGLVLSDEPIAPKTRRVLVWTLSAVMFSPLYLMAALVVKSPGLLALLLILLVFAIGLEMSARHKNGDSRTKAVAVAEALK
jgi:hypothetical protein